METVSVKIVSVHSPFSLRNPKRWLCWIIRKVTGSYWNHSALLVVKNGTRYIVESDINGVVMIPFENYVKDDIIKVSETTFPVEWERISSKIGVAKYDFRNLIIHQTLKEIFGIFITPKEGKKGEKFTCSEFVAYVIDLPRPWTYTPKQISEL